MILYQTNTAIDQTNYYQFEKGFSEQELEWVENLSKLYKYEDATIVGSQNGVDEQVRKSKIKWMHADEKSQWVYEKLMRCSVEANQHWGFDLVSVIDSIQYTEYYEGGGHYDWHIDIGPGAINHRKVSITVQLSDPDEYEGGDFELWTGGEFKKMPRKKGQIILFPSFTMHRVTPVTKGVRKSLVLWVGGGHYK